MCHTGTHSRARFPRHGWLGLTLLAVGQAFALHALPPWSEYWYGLCWSGFIVFGDALLHRRCGRSLLVDRPRDALLMTVVSASGWWLFEALNALHLGNWSYSLSPDTPLWLQRVRSTAFFATLIPATWVATMLALSFARAPLAIAARRAPRTLRTAMVGAGLVALLAAWALPSLALALTLVAIVLVGEPINASRGLPSVLGALSSGDLRLPLGLCVGNLAAGLLGEFWNFRAAPKWTYHVPAIDFVRVFEMPLLGYLGYPLLALALFTIYHFVRGFVTARSAPDAPDDPLTLTGL